MKTINRVSDSVKLMARVPAKSFEEAYPIGNGFSGAMLFGDPFKDRLTLNHDKLWSGYPMERLKEEPFNALERAKNLVKEGKYVEADADISKNFYLYFVFSVSLYSFLELDFALVCFYSKLLIKSLCDILCGYRAVKSSVGTVLHNDIYFGSLNFFSKSRCCFCESNIPF